VSRNVDGTSERGRPQQQADVVAVRLQFLTMCLSFFDFATGAEPMVTLTRIYTPARQRTTSLAVATVLQAHPR